MNKPPLISFTHRYHSEPALRAAIVRRLRSHGLEVGQDVPCATGIADLVVRQQQTITEVYEVKWRLERKALYQAIGQVLPNRQSLNPDARAIVIGYPHPDTTTLLVHIEALDIKVIAWKDGDEGSGIRDEDLTPNTTPPTPITLRWRVKELAERRGITSIRALSFATRASRQNLYPIWRSTAKSISLEVLGTLARTLGADPGEWFQWEGDALHWCIKAVAEAQGLDQRELAWRAHMVPHALAPIWEDRQTAVFIETLAKLAQALQLNVGQLFALAQYEEPTR